MLRKYLIPLIALAGVAFAVFTVLRGDASPPSAPPIDAAPQSPYPSFVAGSGLVEASTENISIGTQIAGIVSRVFVQTGSDVKAGDPLFMIDDRAVLAELGTRRAAVRVAESELAEARYDLGLGESLAAEGITSVDDLMKRRFAANNAEARLEQARDELRSVETELERLTVRAPVDGQVLQLKVHVGEFAPTAAALAGQPPLLLLGGVASLHVRVDVDENDAWRIRAGAPGVGSLRGNARIRTPLEFVRFEPYVVPKKSLTGDSAERVDTRVLQVIYRFAPGKLPFFVGQQMDVFIDAAELPRESDGTGR